MHFLKINPVYNVLVVVVVFFFMNIPQKREIQYSLLSVKDFSVFGTYAPKETMKYP